MIRLTQWSEYIQKVRHNRTSLLNINYNSLFFDKMAEYCKLAPIKNSFAFTCMLQSFIYNILIRENIHGVFEKLCS